MKAKLKTFAATIALLVSGVAVVNADEVKPHKYTMMSPAELAEYLIFVDKGYKLSQPVQEGGVAGQRMFQDDLQKTCSKLRGERATGDVAAKISAAARKTIKYPEGGIKLGDWRIGRELAWSGFGYRVGHKNDNHSKAQYGPGGNCYNCHQLADDRVGGTLGPSLLNYGKLRGNSEAILKYTYEVIYNPHSVFACTNMPRIGAKGILTQEQISHVMAYLLDPESPVNK